jgi:hypothetical protein
MCANSCTRRLFLLVRESVEQIPATWSPQPRAKIARGSPVLEVNCCAGKEASRRWVKEAWLRSKIASRIALRVLALAMAWVGFQLGIHRRTGIFRMLAQDESGLPGTMSYACAREIDASSIAIMADARSDRDVPRESLIARGLLRFIG